MNSQHFGHFERRAIQSNVSLAYQEVFIQQLQHDSHTSSFMYCTVLLNYSQGGEVGLQSATTEGAPHDRKNYVLISMN